MTASKESAPAATPPTQAHALTRKVFRVSRLSEFATVAELTKQTGHPASGWPLVIVKELADNGLDEAEEAGTAPSIEIVVTDNSIMVADHGRGVAPDTIASLIDYSVKTSSRAAYVSPTRGAQGNALQSIFPMGFALASRWDIAQGEVLIESQGVAHKIRFAIDPVRQTPDISRLVEPSEVKIGTRITVRWPSSASSIIAGAKGGFLTLVSTFAWLNPHLTLSAEWRASDPPVHFQRKATDIGWKKWRPDLPTSAHWYDAERHVRLMAAEIAHAEDLAIACPSARDFIGQFRGLTGSAKAKAICEAIDVGERLSLADFHARGTGAAATLLSAMKSVSRPVKPRDLGVVGRDHLLARFAESGADPQTVGYRSAEIEHDGLPYVIEAAFALRSGEDDGEGSRLIEGFNFTPAVGASPFRLERRLAEARVEGDDPITAFVHLASPRLDFLDRGKALVALPVAVVQHVAGLVTAVTKKWTKQKTAEIRDRQAFARRIDAMRRRSKPMSIKEAAWLAMPASYMAATAKGTLPANPRQIMYAARPAILKATGKQMLHGQYFTQTLLPNYVEETGVDWDIVWDDRGHFREPHTDREIGLGTLAVRNYIKNLRDPKIRGAAIAAASVSTLGPAGRYGASLFVEKEGFTPILAAARISERFDIAVMSTKGMSLTAARMLVDELCGRLGLRLFVLRDFDIAGFSIKKTLTESGRRYRFAHKINFIDLGLRLADVERLGLESEPVDVDKDKDTLASRLRINGATDAEIEFLLSGRRVELNSMSSDRFIRFVEDKLAANGVTKVVPSTATLDETYAAFKRESLARQALETELARFDGERIETPSDLEERVRAWLAEHPAAAWDRAVAALSEEEARRHG